MAKDRDLSGQPLSFVLVWGLPLAIGFGSNFLNLPLWAHTSIWVALFAWMGLACLINARRCHRRHCYLAGPALLLGAIATALVGYEIVSIGQNGFIIVTWGTFFAVLLTFVPELIWGKYVK